VQILDPKDWPKDHLHLGVARIVARDGRLLVVPP